MNWITLHQRKITVLLLLVMALITINSQLGIAKEWSEIDWWDVVGEGGSAIAAGLWMTFILLSRPKGRVTDLLWCGLACLFLALFQDFLDELYGNPHPQHWNGWIESGFMPLGIIILSLGLLHWHKEQQALNRQLQKREGYVRQYHTIDELTQLSQAEFIKDVLATQSIQNSQQTIVMLDICEFNNFNRHYGFDAGDKLLQQVTDLLLIGIPDTAILCRYAGDRFALILPNTNPEDAHMIAQELRHMIRQTCFRISGGNHRLLIDLSYGLASDSLRSPDSISTLIDRANESLIKKDAIGMS
ncbi:GGDEF domain-containing protein [Bermanella marisrubri]|uniref:diguanylate cyclase n=1 Tax=Bermanella marisrubri TaxID=207949 RepID=Q1N3G1_9GAMM|nr:GGDEF domain-containing protein [Bermanella marisrubri]EAT12630.1 hypothetical protein RED65_13137 [Oceanobacter sp. RED65] [Bermanella marisrubri]QIZ85243.1 GGDEF domain-containing protein [Bermanella marisrubri]